MRVDDSLMAAITPWGGPAHCWQGFVPRTLIFGATASALHYNTFSRILANFINRLFGIPLLAFYEDLGSPMLFALGRIGLETPTKACRLLGIILKRSKSEWGNPLIFLGLIGHFRTDRIAELCRSLCRRVKLRSGREKSKFSSSTVQLQTMICRN